MKKKVKIIIAAALAVVCAISGAAYMAMPLQVDAITLRPETAVLTFTEQGSYRYDERLQIYPIVAGEVLEVRVEIGDTVKAGDVLAVVNASDFEYQIGELKSAIAGYQGQLSNIGLTEQQEKDTLNATLENLRGQLTSLEAEIGKNNESGESLENQIIIQENIVFYNQNAVHSAKKDLDDARDGGDETEITAARAAHNNALNVLSQSQLVLEQLKTGNVPRDVYEGQRQSLESQISSVQSRMGKSYTGGMRQYYQAQIDAAQLSIAQLEEKAGRAEITAPIAGTVSELPVKDQNFVSQQVPVAAIGSGGRVEVYVPVREIDGVAVGDPVELIVDRRLGKQTISGAVTEVGKEAEARLSALGVEERKVKVLIQPQGDGLAIGYDMDVRFTVYTRDNALVVPKTAVFDTDDGSFVWVIRDGVARKQPIVKGVETRSGYIVEEGLTEGDAIVTDADNADIAEGKKVAAA